MKNLKPKLKLLMSVLMTCVIIYSNAQGFQQTVKIVSTARASDDYFGSSVDFSGDYAIVGEICDGLCAGAAYIYEKDVTGNWNPVQKLVSSDLSNNDIFGTAVSIDGDYAIVTAYGQSTNAFGAEPLSRAGAVYIFKRNSEGGWVQEQKLVASDRAAGDQFGHSASLSGNYAIVGSNFDSEDADGVNYADGSGSAYIFKRDEISGTWSEVKKIVASNRTADAWFGRAVAISDEYAVVGAYWHDSRAGAAYIFQKDEGGTDNWGEVKVLEATDLEAGDWFGVSVDIHGENAVVSAYNDDVVLGETTVEQAGSAFVFSKDQGGTNNWGLVNKLVASDATQGDTFGRSVSMIEDAIVIGAYGESHDADGNNEVSRAGSAYVFIEDGAGSWIPYQKIVASDRAEDDSFGERVGISERRDIIVSAIYEDEDANGENTLEEAGSVYLFSLTEKDQTIDFEEIPDIPYGESIVLEATSSSGLPVAISVISGGVGLDGNVLSATEEVGEVIVRASHGGNYYYNPAEPVYRTFNVVKADQFITFSPIEDKTVGDQPTPIMASASSGLEVSYNVSGPAFVDEGDLYTTGAGSVTVTATQEGNEYYNAAEPVVRTFTVAKAAQHITFPSIDDRTYGDDPFTVSVSASSGLEVNLEIVSGPAVVDGNQLTIIGAGEVTIEATQEGNENYAAAEPIQHTFIVAKAAQHITFPSIDDRTYEDGPFAISASASSGLEVSLEIVSGPAVLDGNQLTVTGAGTVTVEATQGGNDNFLAAESVRQSFIIDKSEQTITFSEIDDKVFGDDPFSLSANASSGLEVSLEIVSGPATLDGSQLTINGAGEVTVEATQEGDENYLAAESVRQSFTIEKSEQTITFDALPTDINQNSSDFELSAQASSALEVSFSASNDLVAINGNTVTIQASGEVMITATQAGNDNYHAAEPVSQVLTIERVLSLHPTALDVRFYPNPVYNQLEIKSDYEQIHVEVFDLSGARVAHAQGSSLSLDLSRLRSGPYILSIQNKDGQRLATHKIVKR